MPVATEIAVLKLKADANIQDASSPAHQKLQEILATVSKVKGYVGQYWGVQVEDPSKYVWTIDWADVSDHHAYMKSDAYAGFIESASAIFDFGGGLSMGHVALTSDSAAAREAPYTEFATFLVAADSTEEQKSAVEDAALSLTDYCKKGPASAFATGWVMEEFNHESASGGKALGFKALIGWPSVEAHMMLRTDQQFVTIATPLRGMILSPTEEAKMFHAILTKFEEAN